MSPAEQMTLADAVEAVVANARGLVHANGHGTEREAAASVVGVSGAQRSAVLLAIDEAGAEGRTDVETEERLGLNRPSGSNRRGELVALGLVETLGERRLTPSGRPAMVWRTTDAGREVAAELRARQT